MTQRSSQHAVQPTEDPPTPVCVVDALHARRRAIGLLIDSGVGLKVVSEMDSATEAVRSLSATVLAMPNVVVVVCFGLTGEHDSLWLIRELRRRFPSLAMVACGAMSDRVSVSQAILAGADGFLDMSASSEAFLDAVRRISRGERALIGSSDLQEAPDRLRAALTAQPRLSPREREVLALAADGLTARQIARRLGIRETTVSTHLSRMYKKLGSGTRISAIRQALRLALVSPEVLGPDLEWDRKA